MPKSPLSATASRWAAAPAALLAAFGIHAQTSEIGIAPIRLDQDVYLFDTAEQHSIRVDVVVRDLARPFSLAFLSLVAMQYPRLGSFRHTRA